MRIVQQGKIVTDPKEIKALLESVKRIAVLGLSPKPERDSHRVAAYLKEAGYQIVPVRPAQKEILGETCYASLNDIPEPVDVIDAFRRSELIPNHVPEALRLKPKVFWMQLGIENEAAAEELTAAGIDVVMNKCIKIEHDNLIRKKIIL